MKERGEELMRCSLILALGLALGATATASADTVDLAPAGDTFVEAGTDAAWDHGAAEDLGVEQSPAHIAHLKFHLSAATAPAVRATLTLFCTDPPPDGGTV